MAPSSIVRLRKYFSGKRFSVSAELKRMQRERLKPEKALQVSRELAKEHKKLRAVEAQHLSNVRRVEALIRNEKSPKSLAKLRETLAREKEGANSSREKANYFKELAVNYRLYSAKHRR